MISRLLGVKDHINAVLEELGWERLTTSQWKQLHAIEELLQPFAHQTNVASICMVIPILKELDLHLKEVRNQGRLRRWGWWGRGPTTFYRSKLEVQ